MSGTDDFISGLDDAPKRRRQFDSPVSGVSAQAVATVAKKSSSYSADGATKRHTIIIPVALRERVEAIAYELGLSKSDAWTAVILLGLRAYDDGERPALARVAQYRNELAEDI